MSVLSNTFSLVYPKKEGRIDLYDFLRGFAMLLVLMQHAVVPGWRYLLVFHMPFFFFLSGFVSGNKKQLPFGQYVWSRFKRLMIPYFAFGIIDVLIHTILDIVVYHQGYSLFYGLVGVLTGQLEPWGGIGIYWFLYTIFVADLLIYPINQYVTRGVPVKLGGVFLLLLLSYCSSHWIDLSLFTLDKSFMAAAFILFGSLCKPLACKLEGKCFSWSHLLVALLGLSVVVVSKNMNSQSVLMFWNQYGDYFWFIIGAVSGIFATLILGKYLFMLLKKNEGFLYRLLMWIGFNSLVLFPVHLQIKVYIGTIYAHLGIGHWYWLVVLPTMLIIGIPVCNFITYYMPFILGTGGLFSKKEYK